MAERKNAIVTTTINPPTLALCRFAALEKWQLYVVGDRKTPADLYKGMPNTVYLSVEDQEALYPELSASIGWDTIQRRNIGFIHAWKQGHDIIASVDDDNIPYDGWGENLVLNRKAYLPTVYHDTVFDPLTVTNIGKMWHRGYPLECLHKRGNYRSDPLQRYHNILVQADLWDGYPDVDAMCRLTNSDPVCRLRSEDLLSFPFAVDALTVFNSQNTFFHRDAFPDYCVLAHVDRMDDIWGGLIFQIKRRQLNEPVVAFGAPSVYQLRNPHDHVRDLERETVGYRGTLPLLSDWRKFLAQYHPRALEFYDLYQASFQ